MKEWKTYRLGDLIKISSGFPYKGEYIGRGENYILGMGCVSFKETFLHSGLRAYSDEAPDRYIAKPGEIVLATRQQSDNLPILGMPAIIPHIYEGRKMIIGANLYKVLNESNFTNEYIYWLMKSPAYIHHIKSCQTGTTVRMITKANIEDFTFKAPEEHERKRISDFLWNLEKKIEINRQINDNLEQQAQALYKSWFVDFEPFKDGEFVESEFGSIPKGWKTGSISDISKISSGKRPAKKCDKKNNIHNIPVYGASGIMAYTNDVLHDSPLLLIGRVGTLGVIQRVNRKSWPSDNTLIILTQFYNYIYFILQGVDYSAINRGSTQPLITQTDINQEGIVIPSLDVLEQFEDRCNSLYKMIAMHKDENIILETIRDTLLPKLMSGELKINEIDC